MQEIQLQEITKDVIRVRTATIQFDGYEQYLEQAKQIAAYIESIEVTEDNVKEAKQVLASARKVVDGLNRRRIDIKNEILSQYKIFENQVKELSSIVDSADIKVRQQVKELEEQARERKQESLKEYYQENIENVSGALTQAIDLFERFIQENQSVLNKSTSEKKAIETLENWVACKLDEFDTLSNMEDSEELQVEYCKTLDLSRTLNLIQEKKRIQEAIQKEQEHEKEVGEVSEPKATFTVVGKANIELVRRLLEENQITYLER